MLSQFFPLTQFLLVLVRRSKQERFSFLLRWPFLGESQWCYALWLLSKSLPREGNVWAAQVLRHNAWLAQKENGNMLLRTALVIPLFFEFLNVDLFCFEPFLFVCFFMFCLSCRWLCSFLCFQFVICMCCTRFLYLYICLSIAQKKKY